MALVNFSGYSSGTLLTEPNFTTGTQSIVSTPVVAGSPYSLRINPTTTGTSYWGLGTYNASGVPTAFGVAGTIYVGFFFQYATKAASVNEEIVGLRTSANYKAVIRLNSAGTLEVYDSTETTLIATGTKVLQANTWYYISMMFGNGTAVPYLLAINNILELSGTITTGSGNFEAVRVGKPLDRNGNSVDYYYGKIQISDSQLPTLQSKVAVLRPTANGTTAQWTAGNVADWNGVKELPTDDDTTYIQNALVASQLNLVLLNTIQSVGIFGKINAVKGWIRIREDTTVTSSTHLRFLSNATTSDTTGRNASIVYSDSLKLEILDPATSAAWTLGGLNALQIGVLEDNGVAVRCTTMAVFVDYTPMLGSSMMGVG